jgi:hypothetical protein
MPKIYGYTEILGDILITGSFSILGSASTIYSTSLVVSDTIITLGHSQSGSPILDEGIMFSRGTGLTQAFIWDETNDTFALVGTNDDHTLIGSVNIDSYSNLKVGGLTTSNIKIIDGASSGYFLQSDSSGNATWVAPTGGLTGSGTASYITKWSSSDGLTNSLIYDNGSTICIGQTTSSTDTLLYLKESSSSIKTGLYTEVSSSTSFNVGISSNVGSSLGFGTGDYAIIGNIGTSTASNSYSFYGRNDGSGTNKYGGYNTVTGNGSSTTNYGSYNLVSGANTNNYGVYNIISGTYGNKYGMYTIISGQGSNYGQYTALSSTGSVNYGLFISSDGATNNFGVFVNSGTNVFNHSAGDYDFQIKGDTEDYLFYIDASTDRLGIGTVSPNYRLHVIGTVSTTGFRMTNGSSNGFVLSSDSDGVGSWTASYRDILFHHSTSGAVGDSLTYHVGFIYEAPTTTNLVTRRVRSVYRGEIVSVNLVTMIGSTLATGGENVIYEIHNLTQATYSTITNTGQLNSPDQINTYVLSSNLTVSEGDELQFRWITPVFSVNPSSVRHVLTAKLRVY